MATKKTSSRKAKAQPRASRVRSAGKTTSKRTSASKPKRASAANRDSARQVSAKARGKTPPPPPAASRPAPKKGGKRTAAATKTAGTAVAASAKSTKGATGAAARVSATATPVFPTPPSAPEQVTPTTGLTRGRYVYCIIRSSAALTFGPIGIGGDPTEVYTVNWRDLAAVMSDSPPGVQDPTRENVLAHQRVNETVMQEHTVLPMSFGTVFKTKDDIAEFLRSAYDAFADVLNKMENKLEFGLKVLWDRDAVLQEIEQEDEDIRRLKSEIASQKGSTYFARMQYGRLVDAALQARSERYVAEIFAALRDVAVAARSNKPIGDRMIMNAAFLVSRPEEPAFDARVKELGVTYDKLTFKYTGPWPPYNFVNIRLKLERA
jgi:hypothetical protein